MRSFSRHGGWSKHVTAVYRSGLEDKVSDQLKNAGVDAKYEKFTIKYTVPESSHTYTPDFVMPNGIIVETKGIFSVEDRKKHLLIQSQYPNLDIRFVFSNSKNKLYKGSKTNYADWCTENNFQYADKWIPEAWFREGKKSTEGMVQKGEKCKTKC